MADAAVIVRPALEGDARRVWEWRNDPTTRAMSGDVELVPWPVHADWFRHALEDRERHLLMVEVEDIAIGMVRFDDTGAGTWRISINIAPDARGRGHGREALRVACDWLADHERPRTVAADIRTENRASRQAFEAVGFLPVGGDEDWQRYLRTFEG